MKTIREKYENAEKLLLQHTRPAVLNGKVNVTWIDDRYFYYAQESEYPVTRYHYVKVDSLTGEKSDLFREDGLVDELKKNHIAEKITFHEIQYSENEVIFKIKDYKYSFDLKNEKLKNEGYTYPEEYAESESYRVFVKNYNLYAENRKNHEIRQLTFDGVKDNAWADVDEAYESVTKKVNNKTDKPSVLFSHDGTKILTSRMDQRAVKDLYVIQGYDDENLESIRPRLYTYKCAFPEDKDIPLFYLFIIDLKTGKIIPVDWKPYIEGTGIAVWSEDDSFLTSTWVERGYQNGKMLKINAEDGKCEVIVNETTDTFLNLGTYGELDGFKKYDYAFSNFITSDGKTAVFQSEREDLAHYYAYDVETKKCLGRITPSDSIAKQLIDVDEKEKYIYYIGTNLSTCSDPYYEALCRVHFDGSGFEILTKEDAFHTIQFHHDVFVDTYSRVDLPPVTVLRKNDGTFISEIEKADISNLMKLGYIIPERFTVKARDGKTDLYGILIKPENIPNDTSVPYVDHIYGGPQMYFVPKKFTWDQEMDREIFGGLESFAKLGIAGIMLDGLGSPGRGKKFHNYSWQNIHGCNGLKDHVTMAAELKKKFPFIDINRAGIWGQSGGGCATSRALLEYPDYFKVGVSSSGNHDQRMYYYGWTERYYGLYNKEHKQAYLDGDNTALAKNLKGHLLIVHGLMDDNVTFPETVRLIDALERADKNFDFFVLPRMNHNVPSDLYFQRRKMDYFVKYLLNEEPPVDFHFKKPEEEK